MLDKTSPFFKPLIASSLAIVLSGGVLSGQDIEVNDANQTQSSPATIDTVTYGSGSQEKKLTLQGGDNTITILTFKDSPSTNNFLILNSGKTTITNKITVNNDQAIVFDLANSTELSLTGGIDGSGKSRVRVVGSASNGTSHTATLSGGTINGTSIEFEGGGAQELKLQNSIANLKTVEMNINGSGDKTLTLDTSSNAVSASVSEEISGEKLKLNFGGKSNGVVSGGGGSNHTASFTLKSSKTSTLKSISIANASSASDNTLTLEAGSLSVTESIDIQNTKGITFNLNTTTLTGKVANKGVFELNFKKNGGVFGGTLTTGDATTPPPTATTNINISDNSSGAITGAVTTNTGGTTNIKFASGGGEKSLTLQGSDNSLTSIILNNGGDSTNNTLILQNGNTTIANQISIQSQQGLILDLQKNSNLTLSASLTNAGNAGIKFAGSNTLTSSITTTAGTTNISLADGADSKITSDISTSGGETTITFNGRSSTLTLNSDNGIITTSNGTTTIDFKSNNGILKSKLNTTGGEANIQLANGAKGTITGDISTNNGSSTNIKYDGNATLILQGSTNTLTTLDTSGTQGTLIIDASSNANTTSIDKAILGDKLIVNLGGTSSHQATLTLNNSSNNSSTIKTLTLKEKTNATQNILNLAGGTTTVTDGVKIGKEQGLSINLSNSANLTSNISNSSGNAEINFSTPTGGIIGGTISTNTTLGSSDKGTKINVANGSNGTIKGNITTGENANTTIIFETATTTQPPPSSNQASELTLQGKTNQINTITVNGDSKTLILDGKNSSGGVNVDVKTAITRGNLIAKFAGETNKATNLALNASGNALKALALGDSSTHNTLTLNTGTTTITDKVTISSNQALDFNLKYDSNLTLTGKFENSGNSNINFFGTSTFSSSIATKTNGTTNINIAGDCAGTITEDITTEGGAKTNVKYSPNSNGGENSLKLMGANNTLSSISFDLQTQSGKLILGDNAITNDIHTIVKDNIFGDSIAGGKLIVEFNGTSHSSKLELQGSSNALKALELYGSKNTLTLTTGNTTITDWVRVEASKGITFELNNTNLTFTNHLYNEGGQVDFKLTGKTTVNGDITTKNEPTGTTIYLSNNSSGTDATFTGKISKDSQSSMGVTTLQFASGDKNKKITLQASGNTLTSLTLGDTTNPPTPNQSTNNTLALTNGNTTIQSEVGVQTSQALTFDLGNNTNLTLSGNLKTFGGNTVVNFSGTSTLSSSINTTSGTTTLNIADSANGSVSGGITTNSGATNINFKTATNQAPNSLSLGGESNQITTLAVENDGNAKLEGKNATIGTINLGDNGNTTSKLTLFNTQSTITTLTPSSSGQTLLSIDGSFNTSTASIANAVSGSNLTLHFNGRGDSNKAELTLQAGNNTFKALTLGSSSTSNKLILQSGKTEINEKINVGDTQDITFDLGVSTELALTAGMETTGSSTLQVVANGSTKTAILSGNATTATHLKLTGNNTHSASITLKNPQLNLTALTTTGKAENTLTLDTTTQGIKTTIKQAISGDNLNVNLKGASGKTATLSLENADNGTNTTSTIKTLVLGDNSSDNTAAHNTLELKAGNTTITDAITIDSNKGINFDFSGTSNLSFGTNPLANSGGVLAVNFKQGNGALDSSINTTNGRTNIEISDGASGVITGSVNGSSGTTAIKFASGASQKSLTLQGGDNKITTLNIEGTNNIFTLNNGTTTIDNKVTIEGNEELTTYLNSNSNLTLTNNLENSGNHTINFNGTSHTLTAQISTLSSGTTSINLSLGTQATITGDTSSAGSTNINLANNSSLTLNAKLSTTAGTTTINFKGEKGTIKGNIETKDNATTTFDFGLSDSQTSIATLEGTLTTNANSNQIFNINAKATTLKVGDNGLSFCCGNNTINLNAENSTLSWQTKDGTNKDITTSGGSTKIDFQKNGTINTGISTSGGSTEISVQQNKIATITGNITTSGGGKANLTFTGSNSALILKGSANTLSQVSTGNGANIISLSEGEARDDRTGQSDRRKLTIGDIQDSGSLTLISQTTTNQADTFLINGSTPKTRDASKPSTHSLGITVGKGVKLSDIGRSGEVLVASVKNTSNIEFEKTSQVISGFTTATATFTTKTTDENGKIKDQGDYTSYFIKSMQDTQVIAAEQEITATAFTLNYDLYMANFNSLNKRMGELRENPHSQGVWLRVFNGALSNDFGLGTKTNYTTIQAGYDYAFGFEGANNYLGIALSYALSTSTAEHSFDDKGQKRSIDSIYSNAVEVALYNSYVSNEGVYNDTIAKFSYIMSDFKINNLNNATSTTNDTKNFALTLSDEVGYKFLLGESKEWGITPQIELGFGYFNQSNFKQTLENLGAFLQSNADAIMTLRTRVGSSFSYDFKSFTQGKNFNASLYLGAFYEYDYVDGGEITYKTDQITQERANHLSHLQSDGRIVLNVGTNMSIKDNTRIYFDFEKSFMGKINTDYQINLGVRYSFGEGSYTPPPTPPIQEESKAPLKINGQNQADKEEDSRSED